MASRDVKKEFPKDGGLYVITDIKLAKPRSYYEIVSGAFLGGAKIVQVRDKTTPFEELVEICQKLSSLADEFDGILIINDNPYLAKASDAHGVHLGQEDTPVQIAREIVGPDKIVGLSTHNKYQAMQACYLPVDYIGLGPIYPTQTKESPYEPLGLQICTWVRKKISLPVVAIGGITMENVGEVIKYGVNNVAVISAIMTAKDIQKAVSEFIQQMMIIKEVYRK